VAWRHADPGEASHRVLHAATIPLTTQQGDFGSDIAVRLGGDDALVAVLEFGRQSAGTALFSATGLPYPTPDMFQPGMLQRTLPGQSGYQRFFSVDGRPLCLYVVLGAHSRRTRSVPKVHQLLDRVDLAGGELALRPARTGTAR
jgi:hypothetical protein